MMNRSISRRRVIKGLSWGAAAAVVNARATGAEPAKLDPEDPAATKLGYVENAAVVDAKKTPGYVAGSTCENCLQLQGKAGNDYRPCSVFPDKVVAIKGWCTAWTPEM